VSPFSSGDQLLLAANNLTFGGGPILYTVKRGRLGSAKCWGINWPGFGVPFGLGGENPALMKEGTANTTGV
jgi:hypothetical protein